MRRTAGYRHSKIFVKHSVTLTALTTVFRTEYDGDEFDSNHFDVSNCSNFHDSSNTDSGKNTDEEVKKEQRNQDDSAVDGADGGEGNSEGRGIEYDMESVQENCIDKNCSMSNVMEEQCYNATSNEVHSPPQFFEKNGGDERYTMINRDAVEKHYERSVSNGYRDLSSARECHDPAAPPEEKGSKSRSTINDQDTFREQHGRSVFNQYPGEDIPNEYSDESPSSEGNDNDGRRHVINHQTVERQYERSVPNEHRQCTIRPAESGHFEICDVRNGGVVKEQYRRSVSTEFQYVSLSPEDDFHDKCKSNNNTEIVEEKYETRKYHGPITSPQDNHKGTSSNINKSDGSVERKGGGGSSESQCPTLKAPGELFDSGIEPYNKYIYDTDNGFHSRCPDRVEPEYDAVYENDDEHFSSKSDAGSSHRGYSDSEERVDDAEYYARRRVCFDPRKYFYCDGDAVDKSEIDNGGAENNYHANDECGGNKLGEDGQASTGLGRSIHDRNRDLGNGYFKNENEHNISPKNDDKDRGIDNIRNIEKRYLQNDSERDFSDESDDEDGKKGNEYWMSYEHQHRKVVHCEEKREDTDNGDSYYSDHRDLGYEDDEKWNSCECSNGFHCFFSYYSDECNTTDTSETTNTAYTSDTVKSGDENIDIHSPTKKNGDGGESNENLGIARKPNINFKELNEKYSAEECFVKETTEHGRHCASKEDNDSEASSVVGSISSEDEAEEHESDFESSVVDDAVFDVKEKRVSGVNMYRGYWASQENQYFTMFPNENDNGSCSSTDNSSSSDDGQSDSGEENCERNVVCCNRDGFCYTTSILEHADDGNEADDEAMEARDGSAHNRYYRTRHCGYHGGDAGRSGDNDKCNEVIHVDGDNRKYVFYHLSGNVVFSSCSFKNTVFNFNY